MYVFMYREIFIEESIVPDKREKKWLRRMSAQGIMESLNMALRPAGQFAQDCIGEGGVCEKDNVLKRTRHMTRNIRDASSPTPYTSLKQLHCLLPGLL